MEKLKEDVKLSKALNEHAVRVMQVLEKVIARIDNPEKGNTDRQQQQRTIIVFKLDVRA